MGGLTLFIAFTASGIPLACLALPRAGRGVKAWLGMTLGQIMALWFPSLFAFFLDYTLLAQWLAAALAALLGLGATVALALGKRADAPGKPVSEPPWWLAAALVIPLAGIMAYLQHTHILLETPNGYLLTGQATNGDLNLHLAIASCLADGGAFPPEYPIYPGVRLGYNFLCDALSASMMTAGSSIRLSFILPGVVHTALAAWGFVLFAWEMNRSKRITALAFLLLFLNGGLGFLYVFDRGIADPSRIHDALYGFYRAPANMTDLNVRWSNLLCDMLLPQRAFAPGWMLLTACLYLLSQAISGRNRRSFILVGLIAGCMPMVHAHSFFALALLSLGAMIYCAAKNQGLTRDFLLYAAAAAVLALPQAAFWILPQAGNGSMRLQFDWVNNQGGRLIDEWAWFWVKNVGLVFLVFVPSFFTASKRARPLLVGAGLVFAAADVIVFQKNVYDNNKIFYAAFLAALPAAAGYLVQIYDRLRGLPGRRFLAGVFAAVSLASGVMTVAREAIGRYTLFGPDDVEAMAWIHENTDKDALFLTGDSYISPVCELAGRRILCGTGSFLYYHSIDYADRAGDEYRMLQAPAETMELYRKYGISFVYVGEYERNTIGANVEEMRTLFEVVYEGRSSLVFRVPAE